MTKKLRVASADVEAQPEAAKISLFDQVLAHLEANDWEPAPYPDKGYIRLNCRLQDARVALYCHATERDNWRQLLVRLVYPIFVPKHRRAVVCEALNHVNVRHAFGNMEMDMEDGEIYVRTVVEITNGTMDDELIARALGANMRIAERHMAALLAVAFGNSEPSTVTVLAERAETETLQ